jgi:predicted permease
VQFALLPALAGYDTPRAHALLERTEDELAALPGVEGVAASSTPFLTNSSNGGDVRVEGFARGPDTDANVRVAKVGPGFFRTMGIPLQAGRAFTAADRAGAPKVAVVNEAFVRKFGLGARAVGARLARDGEAPEGVLDVAIVGVVRDAHYSGVKHEAPPVLYTPFRQDTTVNAAAFYVRAAGAPSATLRAIPGAVARIDRTLPVAMLKPLAQQARESVYLDRMVGALSAGFASLATLLAAVGLFGVLAYTVAQRRREIGVRMALGADAGRVRALVLRQTAAMVLVGGALGVAGALALGRLAGSLLFELRGSDPTVLASATAVVVLVALAAAWLPARRAARVSPAGALRGE